MRRDLKFERLEQVNGELDELIAKGYSTNGNWSLGQICRHLQLTIEKNMDGYPNWMIVLGYPLRPFLRAFALPNLLKCQSPSGIPTAPIFVPPAELDDLCEVEKLKSCIATFLELEKKLHPHPGFGSMSKMQFEHFHAAHAAHHLSFLQPNLDGQGP